MLEEFKCLPESGQELLQTMYDDFVKSSTEEEVDSKVLIGRLACCICHIYGWYKKGTLSRPNAINVLRLFVASDKRISDLLSMSSRKKGDCYKDEIMKILDININEDQNNIDIFVVLFKENDNDIVITPTVYRNILRTHSEELYQEVMAKLSIEHNSSVDEPLYRKLVRFFKPEFKFDIPKAKFEIPIPKRGPVLPTVRPLDAINNLRNINSMYNNDYITSPIKIIDDAICVERINIIKAHIDFNSAGIFNKELIEQMVRRIAEHWDMYSALVTECPSIQKFNVSYIQADNTFSLYSVDNAKNQNIALIFGKGIEPKLSMSDIIPSEVSHDVCPEV